MKEGILKSLGQIAVITGFAVLIWRSSAAFERISNKLSDLETQGKELSTTLDNLRDSIREDLRTINQVVGQVQENQLTDIANQKTLHESYIAHLRKDKRFEDLIDYLKQYNFNVKDAVGDTVKFNLLIRKLK